MPRASGKTTLLIKESAKTGNPIVVSTRRRVDDVLHMANDMKVKIPEPVIASSWMNGNYSGSLLRTIDGLLIDDLDDVLCDLLGRPVKKATYTKYKYKASYDENCSCSLDDEGRIHFNMNALPPRMVDGNLECYVGGDLGWILIDNEDKEEESKMSNSYNLNDFGYFSANVHKAMKRCIKDINVIVPNKVVEITFCDNEKEKMVCHEEDTFDLRRCCFIAIAKHLYKEEYTYEGIEYMAEQIMYQKAFVKTVDQALKKYKKKLVDKEKAEKEEAERKEILKRQAEKKRRYKARRAQRYKEEMVDLIADSINEAKERRK